MDRSTAENILEAILSVDKEMNKLAMIVENIGDEAERKAFRKIFAEITNLEYSGLMLPIFKQYPDLEDDRFYGGQ